MGFGRIEVVSSIRSKRQTFSLFPHPGEDFLEFLRDRCCLPFRKDDRLSNGSQQPQASSENNLRETIERDRKSVSARTPVSGVYLMLVLEDDDGYCSTVICEILSWLNELL